MEMRVLLLPTYFPLVKTPIVGSQIKEQAELLSGTVDYNVIYCIPGMGWKRFLYNFFFARKGNQSCNHLIINGNLKANGVFYFQSPFLSKKYNLRLKCKAYELIFDRLKKEGWVPDLIHARGFECGGIISNYLSTKYGIPYILTENTSFIFDNTVDSFKIRLYKKVLDEAHLLLFVSNCLMRNTLLHGIAKEVPSSVIGNLIDEREFFISERRQNNGVFTIFTTGYNSYIKDYPTFFNALQLLQDRGLEFRVLIGVTYAWSDENRNSLLDLARKFSVASVCHFIEAIPRKEMVKYYNMADVYVSSSVSETFGIAACEALYCGVPVITTANGGTDDFINDENGIRVPIRDHHAMAEAIFRLAKKEQKFDRHKLRASVETKYSSDVFKKRLLEHYNNVQQC